MSGVVKKVAAVVRRHIDGRGIKTLLWATAMASLCGAVGLAEPVERLIKTVHEAARSHDASGSTVVVAIDNPTLRRMPDWTARRAYMAGAVDKLMKAGSRRIFITSMFSDPSARDDDITLAEVLGRYQGRVTLGAKVEVDRTTRKLDLLSPVPELRERAAMALVSIWTDGLDYATKVPMGIEVAGRHLPAVSAAAAGVPASSEHFAPDYAIRPASIPTLSMVDVIGGKNDLSSVRDRDVLIGSTAEALGEIRTVPGHGGVPAVMIHAIATETLRRGVPVELGWMPGAGVALLTSLAYLQARARRRRKVILSAGLALIMTGPIALEQFGIGTQTVPALVLLLIAVARHSIINRIISHPLTGLPTLDRVSDEKRAQDTTLVGMKIANYGDLRANLSPAEEGGLLLEIARRLELGGATDVMHCEDGFVWTTEIGATDELTNNLEGLHTMMLKPFASGRRLVDVSVGFGIENIRARPLNNRVGSVQVAAMEAIASGQRWKVHDHSQMEDADFRLSLMSRLDTAIENKELWVAYQPKLDVRTMRVTGFEALIRWTHPERGMIPPDKFIPAAEQANRIGGLTYFVLDTALADLKRLEALNPWFTVAVNVSAKMLAHSNFPDTVEDYLRKHGVTPARLTVEITETAELDKEGVYIRVLEELRTLGVKISIDDYGTKNSTLDYLRQLPASEIKIDQRFIRFLHEDENARIMASSTIDLAHSLGLTVVAEGVEYKETQTALALMGCDVLQGYYIAKPLRLSDVERFLAHTGNVKVA